MFKEIKNKKVLITGANGGIGVATAELFAKHGALVGIHYYQSQKRALELRRKITSFGGRAEILKEADLTKSASRHNLIREFIQKFGRIDVLVNNAGGKFLSRQETVDGYEMTFALNHLTYFMLTNYGSFVKKLDENG